MSRKNKNNKTTLPETFSLEERLRNDHISHTTGIQASINILKDIILMPFSDFMFFHPNEYQYVMKEFTSHHYESNFPEVPTGLVFEFLVSEIGMSPSAIFLATEEEKHRRELLLNSIYQPFLHMYDISKITGELPDPFPSSVNTSRDLIENSSWKYVNKTVSESHFSNDLAGIPLEKRIQHIKASKFFKASAYSNSAHHSVIPSEVGILFYKLLFCTTFEDYFKCLKSLSLTRISPTRILYNKLEQSHTSYKLDSAILEYYTTRPIKDFESGIYALFIYPMAQVFIALRKTGYVKY